MKHIFLSLMLAAMCWMAYGQKVNHYAGKEYITYNGVKWKTTYHEDDTAYEIRRADSKYGYAKTRYKNGTKVPQDFIQFPLTASGSSTARTEAAKTFAGNHDKLKGAILYVDYWINIKTGEVDDMAFAFGEEWPFTEFDISYFDNLYTRIKKFVKFSKVSADNPTFNEYDGFVLKGNIVVFENMTPYPYPYPMTR